MISRRRFALLALTAATVLPWRAAVWAADQPVAAATPVPRTDRNWVARQETLNARAKAGGFDVMWLGDSITHGWEGGGRQVWDQQMAPLKSQNFGIGGDRTQHVLWRLLNGNLDDNAKPKVAVLMIGTNNVGSDRPEDTAAGITAIVKLLRDKRPECHVLVLAIFPRSANASDGPRQKNEAVNALIAKLDDGKFVHYLDINKVFLADDGTLSKDIMPDLLHPNAKGYQLWADAVVPKIKALLGQ